MEVLESVATWLCLAFVATGAIPVAAGAFQFLVIPFHGVRNHYGRTAGYFPRVAVVIPAWNEGAVIAASIDRLMRLEYPPQSLRVYLVDDASTDDTPDVARAKELEYPGRVVHLRREVGGQGKSHTLNHGIREILADDWMQALLIMDADVIYQPDSMRLLTRHLADPEVGAVTAYIKEGSADPNYLTRFIGYEYIAAQAAARRSQNVLGAVACLAGGAQLHSRENLEAIGGEIDMTSLAEDTFTTFRTQLAGRKVVFEPHAIVLAEEPGTVAALWKQRLRWSRGNVQITKEFKNLWFRPRRGHNLGAFSFGLFWFAILLLPVTMVLTSVGLVGLFLLDSALARLVFEATWFLAGGTYVYITALTVMIDGSTGRRAWREALFFPGAISLLVMTTAFLPGLIERPLTHLVGWDPFDTVGWTLFAYLWISVSMLGAWLIKRIEPTRVGRWLAPPLVYLVGYGPILCAITFDAYIKEYRGAAQVWDKTEKTGRVRAS
ncbi:glycosyltransferase [Sanguibacter suarezii]|uniref:glycosyltransferase n=1 Tax=Sanguibacter suarezii TaxID=60921 RepID=UPI000A05070A|nr:glycosyltransferase [Sanguibacter suarezii]